MLEFSDDEVELWELKATSFLKHSPPDVEGARECYETALRLLDEERNICENNGRVSDLVMKSLHWSDVLVLYV